VGKGRKGMESTNKGKEHAGDFGTPEQQIPATGLPGVNWETCMTMNHNWGYKSYDHDWKSPETLIRNLIDIASKGGNFLLNVGPTAEGQIPGPSVERLSAMGEWMKVNGEAIYGTTASPFSKPDWGRYTKKPGKIFAHVFSWPTHATLTIPAKGLHAPRAYLLSEKNHSDLKIKKIEDGLLLHLPQKAPDPIASVIVITYKE